jgi:transcription antitermination factor NusG
VQKGQKSHQDAKDPRFKWFIVKTLTGQENKVQKTLRENIVNNKMTEFFAEIMVPEESCRHERQRQEKDD